MPKVRLGANRSNVLRKDPVGLPAGSLHFGALKLPLSHHDGVTLEKVFKTADSILGALFLATFA